MGVVGSNLVFKRRRIGIKLVLFILPISPVSNLIVLRQEALCAWKDNVNRSCRNKMYGCIIYVQYRWCNVVRCLHTVITLLTEQGIWMLHVDTRTIVDVC